MVFDFSSLSFTSSSDKEFSFQSKREKEFISAARVGHKPVMYRNALEMAQEFDISGEYFCLVSGSFIYGDFIEALCDIHDLKPDKILLTILGMNENNVDSIVNLVDYLGAKQIGLVVSNYFYSLERKKLMPYMAQEFMGRPISVGVCASHTKICLIDSPKAGKISLYGSANLSSSNNLEQFSFSHDQNIFDYCDRIISGILKKYKVIHGGNRKTRFKYEKIQGNTGGKMYDEIKSVIEEDGNEE